MTGHKVTRDIMNIRKAASLMACLIIIIELLALTDLIPSLVFRFEKTPAVLLFGESPFLSSAIATLIIPAFANTSRNTIRAIIILISMYLAAIQIAHDQPPLQNISIFLSYLGITSALYLIACFTQRRLNSPLASILSKEASIIILFVFISLSGLELTAALRPQTLDRNLLSLDLILFGTLPSKAINLALQDLPIVFFITELIYFILPMAVILIRYWQLKNPEIIPFNVIKGFLLTGALGYLFYFIFPVCGPKFILGNDFPDRVPDLLSAAALTAMVDPFPRNGMPSLHTAWAMIIALATTYLGGFKQIFGFIFLAFTLIATLMLGEHYVLDLYAAIPFALLIHVLLTAYRPEAAALRTRHLVRSGLLTLILCSLAFLPQEQVMLIPVPAWHFLLATCVLICLLTFIEVRRNSAPSEAVTDETEKHFLPASRLDQLVTVLFFVSGFAALVYQVLFSKFLSLTFGSTAVATYTVLATYMIGLASGTFLGGWLSSRLRSPVKAYALAELAIAVYCLATPVILLLVKNAYVALAIGLSPDAGILVFYKVLFGAFTLLVPTILMGLTTPMLLMHFNRREGFGTSVARLYGANTIGASMGALCTGYFLVPWLGASGTLLFAIGANLMIFLIVCGLPKLAWFDDAEVTPAPSISSPDKPLDHRKISLVSSVLFICGFMTLSLETLYIQLLAVVAGNSAYAFSLMLFSFLAGLGLGAQLARKALARLKSTPEALFFNAVLILVAVILLSTLAWDKLPLYFASFDGYALVTSFASREVIRGLTCIMLMIPPAICIGFCFPVAMEILGQGTMPSSRPLVFGIASAFNTAGNIAGVLICGFFLLPAARVCRILCNRDFGYCRGSLSA